MSTGLNLAWPRLETLSELMFQVRPLISINEPPGDTKRYEVGLVR